MRRHTIVNDIYAAQWTLRIKHGIAQNIEGGDSTWGRNVARGLSHSNSHTRTNGLNLSDELRDQQPLSKTRAIRKTTKKYFSKALSFLTPSGSWNVTLLHPLISNQSWKLDKDVPTDFSFFPQRLLETIWSCSNARRSIAFISIRVCGRPCRYPAGCSVKHEMLDSWKQAEPFYVLWLGVGVFMYLLGENKGSSHSTLVAIGDLQLSIWHPDHACKSISPENLTQATPTVWEKEPRYKLIQVPKPKLQPGCKKILLVLQYCSICMTNTL